MQRISLPQKPKYIPVSDHHGMFEIHGCYPGYGATLGNALRRVLLSSLEGAAIHSVKIEGAAHEFSTLSGVMEDAVQIILNLKKVRFRMHGDEPIKLSLRVKGEGAVTAQSFVANSDVEVVNPDQIIANITDKKTELSMEIEVNKGVGYIPVEQQNRESKEIGVIAIDAIYTPIKRVNYDVENMRVGKRTDFDKITLEVVTDGSITPEVAFEKAVDILVEQYTALSGVVGKDNESDVVMQEALIDETTQEDAMHKNKDGAEIIAENGIVSAKAAKVLASHGIVSLLDASKQKQEDIEVFDGMSVKAVKDLKKALESRSLSFK